jgi:hypothetical protein
VSYAFCLPCRKDEFGMNSFYHAKASSKRWGGKPEDYQPIHDFIDSSKSSWGDVRHRAMLHSTWGIFLVEKVFGTTIKVKKVATSENFKTVQVPVRLIAEQHIIEDLGRIPDMGDWLENMDLKRWMGGQQRVTKEMSLDTLVEAKQ